VLGLFSTENGLVENDAGGQVAGDCGFDADANSAVKDVAMTGLKLDAFDDEFQLSAQPEEDVEVRHKLTIHVS